MLLYILVDVDVEKLPAQANAYMMLLKYIAISGQ